MGIIDPLCNIVFRTRSQSSLGVITFSGHLSVKERIIRAPDTNSFSRTFEDVASWVLLVPNCCSRQF